MKEAYRPFDNNRMGNMISASAAGIFLLVVLYFLLIYDNRGLGYVYILFAWFALMIVLVLSAAMNKYIKNCFAADENSVTFMPIFGRNVTVNYRDITEVNIAHDFREYSYLHGRTESIEIETIEIKTLDKTYSFSAVMDNSRPKSFVNMTDITPDMWKFEVLKKYIEQNMAL